MALFKGAYNGFDYKGSYRVRDGVLIWSADVQYEGKLAFVLHGRLTLSAGAVACSHIEQEVQWRIDKHRQRLKHGKNTFLVDGKDALCPAAVNAAPSVALPVDAMVRMEHVSRTSSD